jgi:hypothetical protein
MKRCPGEKSSSGQRDRFQGRVVDVGGPSIGAFARKVKADPLLERTVNNETKHRFEIMPGMTRRAENAFGVNLISFA